MKKRFIPILLIVAFVLSLTANAAELRMRRITPALSFSGTTAQCEVFITSGSDEIKATLELWDGSTKIDSWSGEGTGYLYLSGTHAAKRGTTYTLKVTGTIAGTSFTSTPVSNKC